MDHADRLWTARDSDHMMAAADHATPVAPAKTSHWRLAISLWWTLATTAGWCFGSLIVLLALAWTSGAADTFVRSQIGSVLLGAAFGASIGACQLPVLRRLRTWSTPGWLLANAVSWGAGWALGHALTDPLIDDYWLLALFPGGVLLAATVSLGSWLVLRRYLRHASAWLPAALLGWTPVGIVSMYGGGGLLGMGLSAIMGPRGWPIAVVPGVFAGLITGAALAALLQTPASDAPGTPDQRLATLSGTAK